MDNPHLPPDFGKYFDALTPFQREAYLDPDTNGLTLYQRFALPIIRWFFFGQRASGRSWLLAHILIQEALATGEPVEIFDHYKHSVDAERSRVHMMRLIDTVLRECYPRCSGVISQSRRELTVRRRRG